MANEPLRFCQAEYATEPAVPQSLTGDHPWAKRISDDAVSRRAADECLDVVDQLVGHDLHGVAARPGDVRRQDEVGQIRLEQGIARARRFRGQYVEAGAADPALV